MFFNSLLEIFHRGGILVMSSITAVLFYSIFIILERAYKYFMVFDTANASALMGQVQKLIMNNSIENAIRLCKKMRPNILPHVLAEGLKRANDSTEEVEHAVDHASLEVLPKVDARVPLLGTMANVATLLGLLGTLFGLMKSFKAAANATGAQKQQLLAEGIAEALTATTYGLSTAMICLVAYGILSSKQSKIKAAVLQHSARLVDLLYTRHMKIKVSSR